MADLLQLRKYFMAYRYQGVTRVALLDQNCKWRMRFLADLESV